jgi:hypothetical protein
MGKFSRDKGSRNERKLVSMLRNHGIEAEKIPLSGAAGGSFSGDIKMLKNFVAEAKVRAGGSGMKSIYKWKGSNDVLIISQDYAAPLFVMTLATLAEMLGQEYAAGVAGEPREYEDEK